MDPRRRARTDAERRFGAHALLAGAGLALVAVPFSLLLFMVEGEWRPLLELDREARDSLHAYALDHDGFVAVMRAVSFVGSSVVYTPLFTLLTLYLLWRRLPRLALFVAVTMVGSAILNPTVKELVDRARPVLEDPVARAAGLSFPSGHAQSSVVATSVLLLVFLPLLRGRWRGVAVAAAAAWALAVGFSRVALGVHYMSDVLAGWVLGGAWVALMTAAFRAWRRDVGLPPVELEQGLEPEGADRLRPPDDELRPSGAAGEAPRR
jgi:undecaprenyl-diphosphatase